MTFNNGESFKPKPPRTTPLEAQHPIPQEGKQKIFVHYNFGKGLQEVTWDVTDFNVSDNDGVLLVRNIIHPTIVAALYGPGTWKYVGYIHEKFTNEQKEKEESS